MAELEQPEVLTLEQAAKLLGFSTKTVVKRAREGTIRGKQLAGKGSPWRFTRAAILEALDGNRAA